MKDLKNFGKHARECRRAIETQGQKKEKRRRKK
jgi:hypothetical protein